ncbi:tetratricopeptide repeat protein [Burkholderia sp. Ac-20353]|nr:tetratricopeptide repeat protein [Burkholderia sp. Ac-20353]
MTQPPLPPEQTALPDDVQLEQDLQLVLQSAIAEHHNGALDNAEALYRTLLDVRPHHCDANYNLGLLFMQRGLFDGALPYLETAVGTNPGQGQYWASYIDALRRAGQYEAAWIMLEMAQQQGVKGPAVDTLIHLMAQTGAAAPTAPTSSIAAPAQSRPADAAPADAASKTPAKAKAALLAAGKSPSTRQMQELVVLFNSGRIAEAIANARSLAKRFPAHPMGWRVLGLALHVVGQYDDAVEPLRTALDLAPEDVQAGAVLADILRLKGQFKDAETIALQLLKANPEFAEPHRILGLCLQAERRLKDAEACCLRAVELQPKVSEMHNTLGVIYLDQGRTLDAEGCFRRALDIQPDNAFAHHNMLFCLNHNRDIDAAALFEQHCNFGHHCEAPLRPSWSQHTNVRDPERKLRIGFISADLFHHAVAIFIEPVLAHLVSDERLSIHIYYNFTREDQVTERLRGYATTWDSVWGLSDEALARKIRADGIDILIDLSGHTARNRLLTFARKPAPLQASWIGYPGTTGLQAVDYYLADRFLVPSTSFEAQFTEKIVHLSAVAPFQPPSVAPPVNLPPALHNGYVTFGSFNRLNKLHPDVIALWAQLLRALPTSRMLIGGMPEDGSNGGLADWFAAEGIALERLDFRPRASLTVYMQQHHHVDICLDTFPYAGGSTTLHALWMGVPTITLPGPTVASRGGATGLPQVGLDEFIAQDKDAFVQIGLRWANDLPALAELRAGLRARCVQSPMLHPEVIAAELSNALRIMWRRWCANQPAVSFDATLPDDHPANTRAEQPVAAPAEI